MTGGCQSRVGYKKWTSEYLVACPRTSLVSRPFLRVDWLLVRSVPSIACGQCVRYSLCRPVMSLWSSTGLCCAPSELSRTS